MRRRLFARSLVIASALVALAGGLAALPAQASPVPADVALSLPTVSQDVTLTMRDGVTLAGVVTKPPVGTWPLVVVPGTFAGDGIKTDGIAAALAARGYVTISYTERGFGESTGLIDAAGPKDVADTSDVISWALANTPSDPSRIGLISVSYGAGFLPMVAASDPRVKAIGMVSGWGDMWQSRFPGDTGALASNLALYGLAEIAGSGRLSPDAQSFFTNVIAGRQTPAMKAYAAQRSADNYLPQLAKRNVPAYISTSMNEMIWPDEQTIDFYDAYPGTKHLDVVPGDHATTELGTLIGTPGATWDGAFDWMDEYVAGTGHAFAGTAPIRVAARGPNGPNALTSLALTTYTWQDYASLTPARTEREYLDSTPGPFGLSTATTLAGTAGSGSKQLRQGTNLMLNNGVPMVQGGFEVVTGQPSTVPLSLVDQGVTGLWSGRPVAAATDLRGAITTHLDFVPSAAAGSLYVYALDEAPSGTTYVIGHRPYSFTGATPGAHRSADVTIGYQAYDLPAGDKLIIGVSTGDVMYNSSNPAGSTITIGPDSYVDLPLQ